MSANLAWRGNGLMESNVRGRLIAFFGASLTTSVLLLVKPRVGLVAGSVFIATGVFAFRKLPAELLRGHWRAMKIESLILLFALIGIFVVDLAPRLPSAARDALLYLSLILSWGALAVLFLRFVIYAMRRASSSN